MRGRSQGAHLPRSPAPGASPGARRAGRGAAALLAALPACAGALGASCAAAGTERHVAPLFSLHSSAGGGTELDALGGVVFERRPRPDAEPVQTGLRPFVIEERLSDQLSVTRFLVPLGRATRTPDERVWQLLPIARYQRQVTPAGIEWTFFSLPGIYVARKSDGRVLRGWFPFAGTFERFLFFDRLDFFLWPVWSRSERNGRIKVNVLWPFFGVTYGTGGRSLRIWPLFGHSYREGSWDRYFVLWPFFHYHRNRISKDGKAAETKWMLWPLVGRTRHGEFRSTTLLWPFFGYAHDPSTGLVAWDGPWPLVRFQSGGRGDVERRRVWPLYGYYRGDGLIWRTFLWPLVGRMHEEYSELERTIEYALPFWQHQSFHRADEGDSSWSKLWPLMERETRPNGWKRWKVPQLNPFWRTPQIDEAYSFLWTFLDSEEGPGVVRQRGWLDLWRRESDTHEDRRSFSGLWASRTYAERGRVTRERSLLFGLLRWRTRDGRGLQFLPPAFPGPGWPLQRSEELLPGPTDEGGGPR